MFSDLVLFVDLDVRLREGCWDVETSESEMVSGSGHTNQVDDVVVVDGEAVSCGMDDFVIFTSLADRQYRYVSSTSAL